MNAEYIAYFFYFDDYMHACKFTSLICSKYYKEKKERILHAHAMFDSEEQQMWVMPITDKRADPVREAPT